MCEMGLIKNRKAEKAIVDINGILFGTIQSVYAVDVQCIYSESYFP